LGRRRRKKGKERRPDFENSVLVFDGYCLLREREKKGGKGAKKKGPSRFLKTALRRGNREGWEWRGLHKEKKKKSWNGLTGWASKDGKRGRKPGRKRKKTFW